ncbi:MAG: Gfo/Idh/MocA family oxidoreductase [Planctomycetaceae bacterium]|jgi:predicted dehydrogenase|nr:Gfo/Idh/MocA family oxidoreductase [Planctomycetaceae bacterium]
MKKTNRRQFLKKTTQVSAGILAAYTFTATTYSSSAQGLKNDRPRIGIIGLGGQGQFDANLATEYGDIVAICDVNTLKFNDLKKRLGNKIREDVATYQDYRKLLDRNDIDVVIQAATDHWHTKINIDALRSGRDVYGEKPFSLTIEEGKLLRKVVQESGRVFQLGTQQRSAKQVMDGGPHPRPFQEAVELVRNGRVGKLKQVWVAIPYLSMKGGPFEEQAIPDCLNWDMFQGQSPMRPYTARRYHPFRGWFDYCGSMAADWGNHHFDIAQWGMDTELTGPTTIEGRGFFPNEGKANCFDVPDRFFARLNYANGIEVFFFTSLSARYNYGWPTEPHVPMSKEQLDWMFGKDVSDEVRTCDRNGVMFIGDKGRIFVNRANVYGKAAEELAENPLPSNAWRVRPSENHMKNFFDCVQSREVPVAPAEIGHRSLTPCQLTVISIRLGGRKIQWDPEKEQIIGDKEAQAMQAREQRKPYTIS